jgi:serine/threonine-protein phosphatase 2A regulatory subunit B'
MQGKFIVNLLEIFKSEDPREREYLKTILHRIYGKYMSLRSTIRRLLNNVFYQVIYTASDRPREQQSEDGKEESNVNSVPATTFRHNGISELLEILGSIINGFALPLKEEHKQFLRNILIPLHKIPINKLQVFHEQLSYCITQFIDKDNTLSLVIIGGILKFWPVTSSAKEVLLLNELEEILELTPTSTIEPFIEPIFKRLARSIENEHFQVAERALFYWNNDLISGLTSSHKQTVFPIIVPVLKRMQDSIDKPTGGDSRQVTQQRSVGSCACHWNPTVHSLSLNVIRIFMEIDSDLFNQQYVEELTDMLSKSTLVATDSPTNSAIPNSITAVSNKRAFRWEKIQQLAQVQQHMHEATTAVKIST